MRSSLSLKLYLLVSGAIFLMVGMLHLSRLINHWPVVIAGHPVPHALSIVGFPVATFYAVWAALLFRGAGRAAP